MATARTSLGLGSIATQASDSVSITGGAVSGITDLAVADGGTGQGSYTNGQILVGNTTGNTLAKATITAGTGISVTNGASSITIANTLAAGSSTDNAVARFSGTGGALQNSAVVIDDSNNITGVVGLAASGDITVADNKYVVFGTTSDIKVGYDESGGDALQIGANVEGAALKIHYYADEADDNADNWLHQIADGGVMTWGSKISGSYVTHLTMTPHATAASSTLAAAGHLTVAGNLTVSGTTTTVNSTVTTIKDPLIDLGGADDGGAPGSDDNKDRGLILQYHNGSAAKKAFIGYDDSASKFTMIADASVSSEVVSGTASTVVVGGVEFTDGTSFTTVPHNLGAMVALGVF